MKNVTKFYTIKIIYVGKGRALTIYYYPQFCLHYILSPTFWDRNSSLEEKDTMLRGGGEALIIYKYRQFCSHLYSEKEILPWRKRIRCWGEEGGGIDYLFFRQTVGCTRSAHIIIINMRREASEYDTTKETLLLPKSPKWPELQNVMSAQQ